MQPLMNIAISAARHAGDLILRQSENLDRLKVTAKGKNDYVSEVDIKAEELIIHTIHKAYPEHGFIAEESGVYREDADHVWIIDPLDGTNNYLHGFPFYAVSIALRIKNRIEHAVIYDPLRHECFSASRGRGARLNDRRLRVSKKTQLSDALLSTSHLSNSSQLSERYLRSHEHVVGECLSLRRTGSVALNLAYVASGRLDGFWAYGLPLWDMAAGSLLIQEAGGLVGDPLGGENFLRSGDLVSGAPKIFKALLVHLSKSTPTGIDK